MSTLEAGRNPDTGAAFIRQTHQLVRDLMEPNPAIYWCDFLVTIGISYVALAVYLTAPMWSAIQFGCFFVAGLGLYRSSIFTHELAHIPPTRFQAFRVAWNAIFGVPFLAPSFLYTDHRIHHTNQTYGTPNDGEYYPFGSNSAGFLVRYFLIMPIVPIGPLIRFGLLGPLSVLHPRIRQLVWQRASSLGLLSAAYRRADPERNERATIVILEIGCFLVVACLVGGLITGAIAWATFAKLYGVYFFVMVVNALRVCAAHAYLGGDGPMTFVEQMLDSTTIPGGPWSALWAPLGMRYHALHHLFPAMPYHAMGSAHRRLMNELPADSPYRATLRSSMVSAIAQLYRSARVNSAATSAGPHVLAGSSRLSP